MLTYCFFSAQYLPTVGGVERYTYNMARELIRRGNRVIVVTSALENYPSEEIQDGILVYRFPAIQLLSGRLPVTLKGREVAKRLKLLKNQKIDRIIVQTRLYTLSAIGASFAKKEKIPCIVIEHGTSYVGMGNPLIRQCERLYENLLMLYIKRRCKEFCSVSQEGARWLEHFKVYVKAVLYNSVFEEVEQKVDFDIREKWGIDKSAQIITFVGRLIPEKGIIQLIEAIKKLSKQRNIKLLVAGDGPLMSKLKEEKDDAVLFLGSISHDDVMNLLRQSDVFCLPSDSEGFPTGVVEAVISKCYCVIAPYGGGKELIDGERYGIVMKNNSEEEILKSLKKAVSLPYEQKVQTVKNAYQRFLDGFTWEKTCDVLEKITWEKLK